METCLAHDRILKKGGLIAVNNVLWKGLVLDASRRLDFSEKEGEEKKSRRARRLAAIMHKFNEEAVKDDRV